MALGYLDRITTEPGKCGGRPCIRGLRVRVRDVLELLAAGASHEEILNDYPCLEAADITACLEFAAVQSDHALLRVARSSAPDGVRFLVDNQLPPMLARFLVMQGHEPDHVSDLGLSAADDEQVWRRAAEDGCVMISKDEDFALRVCLG